MASIQTLVSGQRYQVVKAFQDYDRRPHPVGETWVFAGTSFVPYHDGLTLHVLLNGSACDFRFQWLSEEQAAIIENFTDFVVASG